MEYKMKRMKVLLVCMSCMISSSLVQALESKGFDVELNKPIVQPLNVSLDVVQQPVESFTTKLSYYNVNSILIYDYGGDIELQVNSNKLAYKESNVFPANFAKVQNQNFERMQINL